MKYIILTLILIQAVTLKSQSNALDEIALEYLQKYKVPGLSISVIKPDTIFYGVSGVKRCGESKEVGINDKFHIGSNSKSITATIAAMLVESGEISWNTKLLDVFPELKDVVRKEYIDITLGNLLSNRAKIQPFEDDESKEWKGIPLNTESKISKYLFTKYALSLEASVNAEKEFSYSNGGFIIASLMMEKVTDKTWVELVSMFNDTFGVDCFIGFPNQENEAATYGHKKKLKGYKSISASKEYLFPVEFSAAGNFSISNTDLSNYVRMHLLGLMGEDNVLNSKTYNMLHYGQDKYSYGWYNGNIGDSVQKFSYHGGSIGTYSSAIMISADREVAIVILVNSDNKKTNELKEELRIELWEKYGNYD